MSAAENNRKIAEWLGWRRVDLTTKVVWRMPLAAAFGKPVGKPYDHENPGCYGEALQLPDFYADEVANALVLDALKRPYPYFSICFNTERSKTEFEGSGLSTHRNFAWETPTTDRKTAICEAALKLIEKESQ